MNGRITIEGRDGAFGAYIARPNFPWIKEQNTPYEDRDSHGNRYGRREGPYAGGGGDANQFVGNDYFGTDLPYMKRNTTMKFQLRVIDICNGHVTIYVSQPIMVKFSR